MSEPADNQTARSEAARMMGKSRSTRKVETARENQRKATAARTGKPMSAEHKQKIKEALKLHWDTVRASQEALEGKAEEPKRPRGRPVGSGKKKQDGTSTEGA